MEREMNLAERLNGAVADRGKLLEFSNWVHESQYRPKVREIAKAVLSVLKEQGITARRGRITVVSSMLESSQLEVFNNLTHAAKHLLAEQLRQHDKKGFFLDAVKKTTEMHVGVASLRPPLARKGRARTNYVEVLRTFANGYDDSVFDSLAGSLKILWPEKYSKAEIRSAEYKLLDGARDHLATVVNNARDLKRGGRLETI